VPRFRHRPLTPARLLGAIVVVVAAAAWSWLAPPRAVTGPAAPASTNPGADTSCAAAIQSAADHRRSLDRAECSGRIIKLLDDDNDGARHQRLLVRLDTGLVVKVSHNIDLAPRVPEREGDPLEFRGEYEWNDLGGVIHWTHHDPAHRHPDGWLRHNGKAYQ